MMRKPFVKLVGGALGAQLCSFFAALLVAIPAPGAAPARTAPARARPAPGVGAGRTGGPVQGLGVAVRPAGELVFQIGPGPLRKVALGVKPPDAPRLRARLVEVAQGGRSHRVLHVTMTPGAGKGQTVEAAVWIQGRRQTLVFAGTTGAHGTFGAWRRELEVGPRGIAIHQSTRSLARCDGLTARMLSLGYHFATRRLLPILLAPPAPGAVALTATRRPPPGARPWPLQPFRFASASSELGCDGQSRRVSPPSELHDGRPGTAWIEGRGGPGRWEYATAHATEGARLVHAVRLLPGHYGSAAQLRAHNRLKTLWLLLGPKHRYRVTVPADPAGAGVGAGAGAGGGAGAGADPAWWVVLPVPVLTGCLTIVIDEVYPGTGGDTAISEVTVFTALDFGSPVDTMLRAVTAGQVDREEAVRTLLRLGDGELPALRKALSGAASAAEQEVVLRVLAKRDPRGSLTEIAKALSDAARGLRESLLAALVEVGDPAVPVLARVLGAAPASAPGLAEAVLRALARIGTQAAADALLARLGIGSRAARREVARALGGLAVAQVRPGLWARLAGEKVPDAMRADLLRVLQSLATRHPTLRLDAASLALAVSGRVTGFEARYRLLELMGRLGDRRFAPALYALLRSKEDPILREAAARALGLSQDAGRQAALREAMADASPRVRRGAALAWVVDARARLQAAEDALPTILALAERDPWPFVRQAAVAALAEVCPKSGLPSLLRLAERVPGKGGRGGPVSQGLRLRRLALLAGLKCRAPGLSALLGRILRDGGERTALRAFAVRLLAELRDRAQVPYLSEFLDLLAREVMRPRTRNEAFAADIAFSLGRIGDRRALPALVRAAAVSRLPSLQAAALEALGGFCDPTARDVVLRARRSASRIVVGAATHTTRRCKW